MRSKALFQTLTVRIAGTGRQPIMLVNLILLFTITALVELALLIKIGQWTGVTATIGLILLTGVIGGWMARNQGFRIWMQIQRELAAGKLPGDALIEGLIVLMGGCLLVTPGVLTDLLGFLTLIPYTRRLLREWLKRKFKARVQVHTGGFFTPPRNPFSAADDADVHDTTDWRMK